MAASDSVSKPIRAAYPAPAEFGPPIARRRSPSQAALDAAIMMTEDVMAVLLALGLASVFRFDLSPTECYTRPFGPDMIFPSTPDTWCSL